MVQYGSEQRRLVTNSASFAEPGNQRFRLNQSNRRFELLFCFSNNLRGEISRISKLYVSCVEIIGTKTGCFTQRSTDNAATNVGSTRVIHRKLMSSEISSSATQVGFG